MAVTRTGATPMGSIEREAAAQLNNVVADITAIRAAVLAITAKLDLDGGVTDTNYAATCNPAALTSDTINDASGEVA